MQISHQRAEAATTAAASQWSLCCQLSGRRHTQVCNTSCGTYSRQHRSQTDRQTVCCCCHLFVTHCSHCALLGFFFTSWRHNSSIIVVWVSRSANVQKVPLTSSQHCVKLKLPLLSDGASAALYDVTKGYVSGSFRCWPDVSSEKKKAAASVVLLWDVGVLNKHVWWNHTTC